MFKFSIGKQYIALDVIGWLEESKQAIIDDITHYTTTYRLRENYKNSGEIFTIKGKSLDYYIRDFTGEIDEHRATRIATKHHAGDTVHYRLD